MVRTRVGYAGGTTRTPTYRNLGDHTETLQVDFDPEAVSYARLLDVFWASHDPFRRTHATQYKAILFAHDATQRRLAEATRERLAAREGRRVRTEIRAYAGFHPAEDYHQKHRLRGDGLLRRAFARLYPEADALRDSTAAARVNGWLAGHGTAAQYRAVRDRLGLPERALRRLDALFPAPAPEGARPGE